MLVGGTNEGMQWPRIQVIGTAFRKIHAYPHKIQRIERISTIATQPAVRSVSSVA
jgi:hypothetical protein